MDFDPRVVTSTKEATHPLAALLLRAIFGAYMVVAIILTSGQLALDYHRQQAVLLEEVEQLAATVEPIFAHALWNFDDDQLASNLEGILRSVNVFGAQVINPEGHVLAALGAVPINESGQRCAQLPGRQPDLSNKCGAAAGLYAIERPL
ncbi:MAG TPA: hypothetical protein VLC91_15715, partial [Spongiibacteraceae bacterium]|nr:hypothetical protein [Spongiibacteraceae bacterium]